MKLEMKKKIRNNARKGVNRLLKERSRERIFKKKAKNKKREKKTKETMNFQRV